VSVEWGERRKPLSLYQRRKEIALLTNMVKDKSLSPKTRKVLRKLLRDRIGGF